MNGKFAVVGTYDGRCIFYETEVSMASNSQQNHGYVVCTVHHTSVNIISDSLTETFHRIYLHMAWS